MATKTTAANNSAKLGEETASATVAADEDSGAEGAPESETTRALMAENIIKNHVIGSVTASIVPVAFFDIAAVTGIQLRMINKLSELYGHSYSESRGRKIITALAGGVLGYGAGYMAAASAFKLIPGIGWMVGMVSLPAVSGASTYAVGASIVKHYEEGGTLFDFNADNMRTYYKAQFEKGKKVAANIKARATGGKHVAEEEASATA